MFIWTTLPASVCLEDPEAIPDPIQVLLGRCPEEISRISGGKSGGFCFSAGEGNYDSMRVFVFSVNGNWNGILSHFWHGNASIGI